MIETQKVIATANSEALCFHSVQIEFLCLQAKSQWCARIRYHSENDRQTQMNSLKITINRIGIGCP
jgi:hypothetical protein